MRSLLSANLFALLTGALAGTPDRQEPQHKRRPARSAPRPTPTSWRFGRNPKALRHWHNPKDPAQAARIEAAKAKRARRAAKLDRDIFECARRNLAHRHPVPGTRRAEGLNPLHIAQ